jgi:ABC-type Fe3+-hydroxamate transport system substrate-binding protein
MPIRLLIVFSLLVAASIAGPATAAVDSISQAFERPPSQVVSLVPSVTELLFRIGAGDAVVGVTYHDIYPPRAATKQVVGSFFSPCLERIAALTPDLIIHEEVHDSVVDAFGGKDRPRLVRLSMDTFDDLYASIRLLGRVFEKDTAAEALIREIEADLDHTARKVALIPADQRQRVMRLMGREKVMTPGDGSFQNELIRRAGGIPPTLGKSGNIVSVSLEAWQAFNPQILYGCGDREVALKMLDQPGWREVDALKNGRIIYFPCDLTCRLSSRSGYFVSCLASRIYGGAFADLPPVRPDGRMASRSVALPLKYVEGAEIIESAVNDYIHKTLLIHLNAPMAVSSTLEGFREKIRHVGNSFSPPQVWGLYHRIGLEASRRQLMDAIGRNPADTSLLFTGADMDNLSVQRQNFKDMAVYALVTAGVRSNAVRMAEDVGAWYSPHT